MVISKHYFVITLLEAPGLPKSILDLKSYDYQKIKRNSPW